MTKYTPVLPKGSSLQEEMDMMYFQNVNDTTQIMTLS